MVTNCGAPNQIRSDNAPKFRGRTWMTYLCKHQIQSAFTEGYHPNEDPCECWGGALKAAIIHCLEVMNADLEFWCYCLEHICVLQSVIAHRWLRWWTLHELHYGDTPNISMFRFEFWCPVWYYAPKQSSPSLKCCVAGSLVLQRIMEMLFVSLFLLTQMIPISHNRSLLGRW